MNNLSSIFFSQVQQKVLSLLFIHYDRTFHTNDIIRLSSSGTGAVHRELNKMVLSGILILKKVGNQKHYQANKQLPFFSELRSIILKTFGLTYLIQEALAPIASQMHVAFIYGSIAKQEDNASSDIDLMIISDTLSYVDLFTILEKLQEKLTRTVNPTFYSSSEWIQKKNAKNNFINQIINQPKIFVIGSDDEFSKFR